MAKATYTGPSPAELYEFYYEVVDASGSRMVVGTRMFNKGVSETVEGKFVAHNLEKLMSLDPSVMKLEMSKQEAKDVEALRGR